MSSKKGYADPFNDVQVTAEFIDPDGEQRIVPAFWGGKMVWKLRYASGKVGRHRFKVMCSDESNDDLTSREGSLEVIKYKGSNPLLKHGPLRVSKDGKHLEHLDGRPFFWLGDTWWMGLTKRLPWPDGFQSLTRDRVRKGFTLIQIVAGLYPDMPQFDPRGANEAGFPWEKDYSRINPAYFNMADRRIEWLVRNGLVPCIVGSWGYFMEFAGEETMKKHWHNLVARYAAYPVVWCVAGEAVMPYYLSKVGTDYTANARASWTRVARYIRSLDAYHNPITIHPTDCAHNMVDDPSVIDVDMLQTGHSDVHSFANTVDKVSESVSRSPRLPVIVGEVCYEGILGASWENIARLMFWTSLLSGSAGHTYGANGIWQVNTKAKPFGPSPHGRSWGDAPWDVASKLPGSWQVALGKALLERYEWWRFEPHPEWVEPHWTQENRFEPYAAGIPREVRVIYIPWHGSALWSGPKIIGIEQDVDYHSYYYDPRTGREYGVEKVSHDVSGEWHPSHPPIIQDWVLVVEQK